MQTIGFEVEISIGRTSNKIIPKSIRGLRFNNYESSRIIEYITEPISLEDWRKILLLAKNVYYSSLFDFDLRNHQGAVTTRGESLHFHIPFELVEGVETQTILVTRNLLPLLGRGFEFRETIRDRATIMPYSDRLPYNSKLHFITKNVSHNKDDTLEVRINESLLGGWFTALVLSSLEDIPIDLQGGYWWGELSLKDRGDRYFEFEFEDFRGFTEYLQDLSKVLQRKYQHNEVVWYFLNKLPSLVKREKKGWERRLLEVLYKVKDKRFQRAVLNFEKKDKKIQDGFWPQNYSHYIKLF